MTDNQFDDDTRRALQFYRLWSGVIRDNILELAESDPETFEKLQPAINAQIEQVLTDLDSLESDVASKLDGPGEPQ